MIKRTLKILSFLLSVNLQAMTLPFSLPAELLVNGKPIPPLCFAPFVNLAGDEVKPLSLKSAPCLKSDYPYNPEALTRGFLGYNLPMQAEHSMRPPAIFYRYVGNNKNHFLFELNYSGGGSGFFSSIVTLELKNGALTLLRTIDGGDRCMGGVSHAELSDGRLSYQKKLTPLGLVSLLTTVNNRSLESLSVYPDCAVCCIGELTIKDKLPYQFKFNGELISGASNKEVVDCINKKLKAAGATEQKSLGIQALRQLLRSMNEICLAGATAQ